MSLSAGTRVGPYEILSALGAGGMSGYAEPRTSKSEARHQRKVALGVGPQRHSKKP
jgi:hypothetical protein